MTTPKLEELPRIEIDWSGHRTFHNMTTEEIEVQEAEHQHDLPKKDEDDERR